MGLFGFGGGTNINEKIEEFKSTNNSILLDVRTVGEYQEGHIENSINAGGINGYKGKVVR